MKFGGYITKKNKKISSVLPLYGTEVNTDSFGKRLLS